jgi:transcriptional regulator with XRE-family HTH domain
MEQRVKELFARAAYHNIKQYQIAEEAGIRTGTVSNWRIGRKSPLEETLILAEKALERLIAGRMS